MGKLTNDEIKEIIRRASILQKFHEQSLGANKIIQPEQNDPVFEVGDSLNIKRHFIREALLEYDGVTIEDPVMIDNNSASQVEIQGYANGPIDGSLLNELRAQVEYHFNTVGSVSRRKGKIFWQANPSFPFRFLDISKSPLLEIEQQKGRVKLTMHQSLKTLNKLYIPPLLFTFGAFMLFAAVVLEVAGNEAPPMLIFSGILLAASFGISRFVRNLKKKKKKKLLELVETLQQIMERRFRAGRFKEEKVQINLDVFQNLDDEDEIEINQDIRMKN